MRSDFLSLLAAHFRRRASNQRGVFVVFVMISFVAIAMIVGIAIDVGRAYVEQSELGRTVDSASLAAASQYVPNSYSNGTALPTTTNAYKSACNSILMNGYPSCPTQLVYSNNTTDAAGNAVNGIRIAFESVVQTKFLRLGRFLGCGNGCNSLKVSAAAVAAPGANMDLTLSLDDTGSMDNSWLTGVRSGANAFIDGLIPTSTSTLAKISVVPFRGCYSSSGGDCIDSDEYSPGSVVSLSASNSLLHGVVNNRLTGNGGSGSNLCDGLAQARLKLFDSTRSRPGAMKFMIMFTDAESSYDSSRPSNFSQCRPGTGSGSNDKKISTAAYNLATDIKLGQNVGSSGQPANKTVEIFVIVYGTNSAVPASCTPPTGTNGWTQMSLARCIASSAGNVYKAPTASDVQKIFYQVLGRLPTRLVN